jgi:hypothetical protein
MDYAQIWNFVGPSAIVSGDKVEAATADGLYREFDDDQLTIIPGHQQSLSAFPPAVLGKPTDHAASQE